MSSRRVCLFCGGSPLTSAHIISRRLQGMLPPSDDGSTMSQMWLGGDAPFVSMRTVNVSPFDHQVKRMCWPCNGEWMNSFEAATAETVAAMALGRPVSLTPELQWKLSTWLQIVVMLRATQDTGGSVFHPSDYQLVRESSIPLLGTRIWAVNMVNRPDPQSRHLRLAIELEEDYYSAFGMDHVSFIWIGQVAFVVASERAADLVEARLKIAISALREIYPISSAVPVPWPPRGQTNGPALFLLTTITGRPGREGI